MSFFDKWIFPRLVDVVMRNKEAKRYRSQIVPNAHGTVLEIGVGSGLNLPFYGTGVEQLYGLDPSEELLVMAGKKSRAIAFPVDFLAYPGEEIPDRNLPFYGTGVEQLYGLDPSEELLVMAGKKSRAIAFPVDFLAYPGEEI